MKKQEKALIGGALGTGAILAGAGALLYNCVLNMKLQAKVMKTGLFDNKEEVEFWKNNEIYNADLKWFDDLDIFPTCISSRLDRDIYGLVIPCENETDKWAIVIHGYSANPRVMSHYARKYYTMGFNVVMPHLVAHGLDSKKYCSMGYYDRYIILDWIDYIINKDKNAKIILHGVSMGSATTMLTTGEQLPENVVVAVADCGYTSCWDEFEVQSKSMLHLPPEIFVNAANVVSVATGNFNFKKCSPVEAVAHSKTPTLFIHGEADTFVPYSMMKPLYEACSAPDKDMLSVPNAFHASSAFFDNEGYWKKVTEFIGKHMEL